MIRHCAPENFSGALLQEGTVMDIKTGFYRHFKGKLYEVIGTATHSETREPMVVYRALYGEYGLWVRPAAMWNETVDRDGYHGPRFQYIGDKLPENG